MNELPFELRLVVEPGSEPISGSLGRPDGPQETFSGWLDLAAAIDALTRSTIRCDVDAGESP